MMVHLPASNNRININRLVHIYIMED